MRGAGVLREIWKCKSLGEHGIKSRQNYRSVAGRWYCELRRLLADGTDSMDKAEILAKERELWKDIRCLSVLMISLLSLDILHVFDQSYPRDREGDKLLWYRKGKGHKTGK